MEAFSAYSHAIAALAFWSLICMGLVPVSVRTRSATRCDCGKPKRDYADKGYRSERALMNAVESSGPFIAATVAAILAGAAPFWVNLFASLFVLARIVMAYVHIQTTQQTARSIAWSVGLLCTLAIALLALGGVFL